MEKQNDLPQSLENAQIDLETALKTKYSSEPVFTEVVDDQIARIHLIKTFERRELDKKLYQHAEMVTKKCNNRDYMLCYQTLTTILGNIQTARATFVSHSNSSKPGTNPLYLASEYADNYFVNQVNLLK